MMSSGLQPHPVKIGWMCDTKTGVKSSNKSIIVLVLLGWKVGKDSNRSSLILIAR